MIDDNSSFMGYASLGYASKKIRAFYGSNEERSDFEIRSRVHKWCTSSNWDFVSYLKKAGDGARTRDIQLGKLTLYQLSYSRLCFRFMCF